MPTCQEPQEPRAGVGGSGNKLLPKSPRADDKPTVVGVFQERFVSEGKRTVRKLRPFANVGHDASERGVGEVGGRRAECGVWDARGAPVRVVCRVLDCAVAAAM